MIEAANFAKQFLAKKKKTKPINESLASLEEKLFEAEKEGNKRKQDRIKDMIKRFKKIKKESF